MTDKLPPNLLALFAPRPPLRWVPPPDYPAEDRRTANISGLAGFLGALKEYKDNDNFVPTESWLEARDRKKLEKKSAVEQLLTEAPKNCETICNLSRSWVTDVSMTDKPAEDPNIRGDAFKTLMVCRLSYQATEEDLEREFGRIGSIERVRTPLPYSQKDSCSHVLMNPSDPHRPGHSCRRKTQQEEEATPRLCIYRV